MKVKRYKVDNNKQRGTGRKEGRGARYSIQDQTGT